MLSDFRFALRQVAKSRGFTLVKANGRVSLSGIVGASISAPISVPLAERCGARQPVAVLVMMGTLDDVYLHYTGREFAAEDGRGGH